MTQIRVPTGPRVCVVVSSTRLSVGSRTPGGSDPSGELPAEERARIQRHTLQVLFVSQMLASTSVPAAVTVGARIAKALLKGDTFAGSPSAMVTLGAAACAVPLSRLMQRVGRRPGMQLGYLVAFFGAVVSIVGAEHRSFAVFLLGCLFFGFGQGTNQFTRFAAADLALPGERGRAISTLVFASTFGGVLGPSVANWSQGIAGRLGLWRLTGPYLLAGVLLLAAALHTSIRLRPDPLVVSGGTRPTGAGGPRVPPLRHALRIIATRPAARVAAGALAVSQVTMVAVMTMTPVHMAEHGNGGQLSSYVIALHVFGMYGFSIVVGRLADRAGRPPLILVGAATLMLATVVSALAGYRPVLLFLGLFLLGLGWSFTMVSASAMLTESVPAEDRVGVQGSSDLITSLLGATAAFASGFVKRTFGFHMLANAGTVLAFGLFLAVLAFRRTTGATNRVAA